MAQVVIWTNYMTFTETSWLTAEKVGVQNCVAVAQINISRDKNVFTLLFLPCLLRNNQSRSWFFGVRRGIALSRDQLPVVEIRRGSMWVRNTATSLYSCSYESENAHKYIFPEGNLLVKFALDCCRNSSTDEEVKDKKSSVQSEDDQKERNPTSVFNRRKAFKNMKPADKITLMREKIEAFPGSSPAFKEDRRRHTARVVVMGDDRVLGTLTRAYCLIRWAAYMCLCVCVGVCVCSSAFHQCFPHISQQRKRVETSCFDQKIGHSVLLHPSHWCGTIVHSTCELHSKHWLTGINV